MGEARQWNARAMMDYVAVIIKWLLDVSFERGGDGMSHHCIDYSTHRYIISIFP